MVLTSIQYQVSSIHVFAAFEQMVNTSIRAQGMGEAFSAIANDAHSWLINPAGLGQLASPTAGFSRSTLYPALVNDNISQNFAGFAYPLGNLVFGLTWANLYSKKYSENIYAFSLSSQLFLENLYLGMNYKLIGWDSERAIYFNNTSEDLGGKNYGIDFGLLYGIKDNIYWGLNLINLNYPELGDKKREQLPLKIKTGLSYNHNEHFNTAFDSELYAGVSGGFTPQFSIGLEKWFVQKTFALRSGWKTIPDGGNLSFGASYRKKINRSDLGLDFAFIYPLQTTGLPIFRFSLLYWLGKKEKKEETKEKTQETQIETTPEVTPSLPNLMEEGEIKLKEIIAMTQTGVLKKVEFKSNSAEIVQGQETLDEIGKVLLKYSDLKIRIEAHTPPVGEPNINLAISNSQAITIRDYLSKQHKVDPKRMIPMGHGGNNPIYPLQEQGTEEIRGADGKVETREVILQRPENIERNRRVEFNVIEE